MGALCGAHWPGATVPQASNPIAAGLVHRIAPVYHTSSLCSARGCSFSAMKCVRSGVIASGSQWLSVNVEPAWLWLTLRLAQLSTSANRLWLLEALVVGMKDGSLLPAPCSLLLAPSSPLPVPWSLIPVPCSFFLDPFLLSA